MKKNEVKINGVYTAKVSDRITGVRILKENPNGGWEAVNLATNKPVRIKSARRLRGPFNPRVAKKSPTSAPVAKTTAASSKNTTSPKNNTRAKRGKGTSGLDAAVKVLQAVGQPLSCKTMVNMMLEKGYWQTKGQTPANTLYAAILREIAAKGDASRFRRTERGKFTLAR